MWNPYRNLDKALLLSRNQVFCLTDGKLWRAPTILQLNIFCWNFAHVSYLPISTNGCSGLFFFSLDLELFEKNKKREVCLNLGIEFCITLLVLPN